MNTQNTVTHNTSTTASIEADGQFIEPAFERQDEINDASLADVSGGIIIVSGRTHPPY
jgi:hypothetical protein